MSNILKNSWFKDIVIALFLFILSYLLKLNFRFSWLVFVIILLGVSILWNIWLIIRIKKLTSREEVLIKLVGFLKNFNIQDSVTIEYDYLDSYLGVLKGASKKYLQEASRKLGYGFVDLITNARIEGPHAYGKK